MSQLRPMLAGKVPEDLDKLRFPLFASPKLDGIRCLIVEGRPVSRTLKLIRNDYIQECLSSYEFEGLDGELIVGSPSDPNCMQKTNSGVMSYGGQPDFKFHVFDIWNRGKEPFSAAYNNLLLTTYNADHITLLEQEHITSVRDLEDYESDCLSSGYEGVVTRDPAAPYKFNRSTTREQWLLKMKRFEYDEAMIIGYKELEVNANELTTDERGYAKRSAAKDGKILANTLGALVCRQITTGKQDSKAILTSGPEFDLGVFNGVSKDELKVWWANRESLIGRIVVFRHFAQQGVLNKPRIPVFISFRELEDL